MHGACVGLTLKHQSGLNVDLCLGPAVLTADGGSEKVAGLWAFLMGADVGGGSGRCPGLPLSYRKWKPYVGEKI